MSDVQASALRMAHAQAARWLATRFPVLPAPEQRFIAKQLLELMYPYVKIAVYTDMAGSMHDSGHEEFAAMLDSMAREFLAELLGPENKEE